MRPFFLSLVLLAACRANDKVIDDASVKDTAGLSTDADGDGYTADEDCDDNNSLVNPGAAELCDGADNNCDGQIDEGVSTTFYADSDGDGFGDDSAPSEACEAPTGTVPIGNDCDDADETSYPGAEEVCDGADNDCDGEIDDGLGGTWYPDLDQDGYGDDGAEKVFCTETEGYVGNAEDCDDLDAAISPDGEEVCDEIDNNCDGQIDEGVTTTFYADDDSDGFGDLGAPIEACSEPSGAVSDTTDCDDNNGAINPGALEVCNSADDDCDGQNDEDAADAQTFYADADSDGYGDATDTAEGCTAPSGYGADDADCDDADAAVNPGAAEACNGTDDDCDGQTDEGVTSTFYGDSDGDGYGDAADTAEGCTAPSGYGADDTDCDDADAAVNPGASEVCNGTDDDCDSLIDDDDSSLDASSVSTFYADDDGDGYGDDDDSTEACAAPSGYRSAGGDCDDSDGAISPGASEVCNSIDDDCDGLIDDDDSSLDASSGDAWYGDADMDGYGDEDDVVFACDEPSGYVSDDTDCDDDDTDTNPAATDECDGLDNDCDGTADDDGLCPCDVEHDGGTPYMFCDISYSWSAAESYCDGYGYHLVTIDDATEDSWLDSTADSYSTSKWWMGYTDASSEGTWVWADGGTATYTNWSAGEPNNAGGNEDCGQLNRYTDGTWNDEPCSSAFYFICEAN